MKDFRKLKVWEKSHQLTLDVYRITASFPKDELYGLTSQFRRSASSVPTNIAEGSGRRSDAELAKFLTISMGSASELEYPLLLASELGDIENDDYQELNDKVNEIQKMLTSFIKKLKANR